MKLRYVASTSVLALLLHTPPIFAQADAPPSKPLAQPAAHEKPGVAQPKPGSAQSWVSESVLVTAKRRHLAVPDASSATRTDTPIIQIPQSVQVITSSLIEVWMAVRIRVNLARACCSRNWAVPGGGGLGVTSLEDVGLTHACAWG